MTVAQRIGEARAASGLTQAQLASAVGVERSALAKIETGARRVSAVELVAIARELRRRVEWFVEPGPSAIMSYRVATPGVATQEIDRELERIVGYVEFVAGQVPDLLGNTPEVVTQPRTRDRAETFAGEVRGFLNLAPDQPVRDLSRLVADIGLLVFSVHLGEGADAGTVLLERGGVTVVNGDLRVGGRRLALAHELGHYMIADPYTTDWRIATTDSEALEARLDRFARALLLPAVDLLGRWTEWRGIPGETLRDAAVRAGSHYRVDMATLARRLAELGLLPTDQADPIRHVRTKKADIVEKNLAVAHELEPVSLPLRYQKAVLGLYRREVVTEDRALGLLMGTFDQDGLPDLPPVPEGDIWAVVS